jgi:ubiquinone/menaquinone biosynthesis C-methylase UbiE
MPLRSKLFEIYGGLRDRIAPGLRYAQHFYERELAKAVTSDTDWLDLGCGHRVLPEWREVAEREIVARCRSVTGIDYDMPSLRRHRSVRRRVRGEISSLPFSERSFDLVTANMVVEHLADPATQFREIARVLRPGGLLLVHTPNAHGYATLVGRSVPDPIKKVMIRALDSRSSEDVFPTHYRANTRARLVEISRSAGLVLADVRMVATDALFAVVPPLAAAELLMIRLLMTRQMKNYRPNIIATMRKA